METTCGPRPLQFLVSSVPGLHSPVVCRSPHRPSTVVDSPPALRPARSLPSGTAHSFEVFLHQVVRRTPIFLSRRGWLWESGGRVRGKGPVLDEGWAGPGVSEDKLRRPDVHTLRGDSTPTTRRTVGAQGPVGQRPPRHGGRPGKVVHEGGRHRGVVGPV